MEETNDRVVTDMPEQNVPEPKGGGLVDRNHLIYSRAYELYTRSEDWVVFFREILGAEGLVPRHYPTHEQMAEFERTQTYTRIQQMLVRLRQRAVFPGKAQEPTAMITVRLPKSMHEALREEARRHNTSVNKLCISKLLQLIDNEFVPEK